MAEGNFDSFIEIEYELPFLTIDDVNDIKESYDNTFTFESNIDFKSLSSDLNYSKIKLKDFNNKEFLIKRDENTYLINNLTTCFPTGNDLVKLNLSASFDENLQFNSPSNNSDYFRKLYVGHTPFIDKFKNSPLFNPSRNIRFSSLIGQSKLLDEVPSMAKKGQRNDLIMRYINCFYENSEACNKQHVECRTKIKEMKTLFLHIFYLIERSIILRVVDENDFYKPDIEGKMNDKYITPYNCYHALVTFDDITQIDSYMGVRYYRAINRFDSKLYCLKVSDYNKDEPQMFNKTSRLLHNEVLMLSRLKHENIIRYYSSWIEYQSLFEQIEYNYGSSLEDVQVDIINDEFETRFLTIRAAKSLVCQICSALSYLHETWKVVHNNIAPHNILLFDPAAGNYLFDNDWFVESLFRDDLDFRVIFKLAGFENALSRDDMHHCNKDVQDLASVAAESIGEDTVDWKYASPTRAVKVKQHSDENFVLTLTGAVLGRVESAQNLMELIESA